MAMHTGFSMVTGSVESLSAWQRSRLESSEATFTGRMLVFRVYLTVVLKEALLCLKSYDNFQMCFGYNIFV